MQKNVKISLLLLTLLFVSVLSLSSVCAQDTGNSTDNMAVYNDDESISIENQDEGYADESISDVNNDEKLGYPASTTGSRLKFGTEDFNITEGDSVQVSGTLVDPLGNDPAGGDFSLLVYVNGNYKMSISLNSHKLSYTFPASWFTVSGSPYTIKFVADEAAEYEEFLEESGGAFFADSWVNVIVNPESVEPQPLAEAYVDYANGADTNEGTSSATAFKTIEHALSVIEDNGIIHLIGINYIDDVGANGLTISKSVSIVGMGDGAVIDARGERRIFSIGAYTVNLENIVFKNANSNSASDKRGGALYVNGAVLSINNCEFINNTAGTSSSYGGAINLKSSTTTIENTVFDSNSAWYNGAAINAENTNVLLNISGSTFKDSLILNNGWSAGSAICSYNTVIIDNSLFYGNRLTDSSRNGKTINQYGTGSLTITNSVLLDGEKAVWIATGPTTLENNWWGNNDTTKASNPKDLGYTNADVTSYLYLNLSSASTKFEVGTPVTVNVNLVSNDGSEVKIANIPAKLSSSQGTFDNNDLTLVDGEGNAKYTSNVIGSNLIAVDVLGINDEMTLTFEDSYPVGQIVPSMEEIDSGVVSGGAVYVVANPVNSPGSLSYVIPDGVSDIKSVVVIVNVYSGSGAPTYALYSNVTLNTNNGLEVLGYEALTFNINTANDPNVYGINDHTTKQYSDYQMVYDITDKVNNLNSGDTITIGVENSRYPDKQFDGRIKLISLFFAYDDGDNDNITYWLNAGQVWTANTASFDIGTKDYTGKTNNMTLRTIALSSSAGSEYKINNIAATPDSVKPGSFTFQDVLWENVGTNFNPGSDTNLWFKTGGASYKTNVALLVASEIASEEPLTEVYVDYANGLDTNLGTAPNNAFKTIEHALSVVEDNGIIHLIGTNYIDDLGANGLTVAKSISIVGMGDNAVIDARGEGRIFNIGAYTVNLADITFINGNNVNGGKHGGAVFAEGSTLTIDNCKFINNTAGSSSSYGGAVNVKSSTTTITNSYFEGNTAYYTGAAVNAESGNVLLNISNSVFTENEVLNTGWATGGAICTYGTVIIDRSTFYGNKLAAGKNGRTINQYGNSPLTITNSVLLDGDLSVYAATPAATTLENNWWGNNDTTKASNPKGLGYTNVDVSSYMYLNMTIFAGSLDVGSVAFVSVNLVSNDGSEAGAFDLPVTLTAVNGTLSEDSLILTDNTASTQYTITAVGNNMVTADILGIKDSITLDSGDIVSYAVVYVNATGGSDSNNGVSWETAVKTIEQAVNIVDPEGIIYVADGLYELSDSTPAAGIAINKDISIYGESINAVISGKNAKRIFTISSNSKLTIRNLTLTQGYNSGFGGAILIEDAGNTNPVVAGKLIISDSVISNSRAANGGAIGTNRGSIDSVNNVTFIGNRADSGGAIYLLQKGTLSIGNDNKFISNTAGGRGSAINSQVRLTLGSGNLFDSNVATGTYGYGAICTYGFDISPGNVFINNRASVGGALYLAGNSYTGAGSYCFFINNTDNNGYTIGKQSANRQLVLDNCYWGTNTPNFSTLSTGAITYTNYLILNVSADKENVAVGDTALVSVKLLKNNGANVDLSSIPKYLPLVFTPVNGNVDPVNAEIVNAESSTTYAPAVMGNGSVTVNLYAAKETIDFNVLAELGTVFVNYTGGVDTNAGDSWDNAVKTIAHALEIVGEGNTIYIADGINYLDDATADGLTIAKNVTIIGIGDNVIIDAEGNGRIFNIGAYTVNLENIVFKNGNSNSASDKRGGALYINGAVLNINNCEFINNTAGTSSSYGGAINLKSSTTTIENTIFDSNSAWYNGAAINAENTNVLLNISGSTFKDSLILNNGWSAGSAICSYNTVIIDNSLFYGNRLTDSSRNGKTINQYGTGSLTITNSVLLDGEKGVWIATGPATLENNWWGNNDTTKDINPKDLGYTNANVESYFVLSSVVSKEEIYMGDIVTVTTTLTGNGIELPITFDVNIGAITPEETTITNNVVSTYNATAMGDEEITVDVLGVKNVISFKVKETLPDVTITSISSPWATGGNLGIYAGLINNFTIKLNNGEMGSAENITLEVYSNESGELIASYKWDSLASGTSTVLITDPIVRPINEQTVWPVAQENIVKYTFNLLRGEDLISSTTVNAILAYNGYLNKSYAYGGNDNIINRNYTITGDIIISIQDVSVYMDQFSRYRKETWNIETPEDAENVKALLFFSYNWDTSYYPNGWTLTFNEQSLVGENVSFEMDRGNLGGWGAYDYGLLVFDVTDVYKTNENNSFIIEKTGNCALYPSTLVVMYDMPNSEVFKDVYFSDICDVYYPNYNMVGYDDLLKTVVYYNGINTTGLIDATWYAFGASGGNNDASLSFNDVFYDNAFKDQSSNDCKPYVANVTDFISENNEAWFITTNKSSTVVAYEQILVITRANEPFENELIIPDNLTAGESADITLTLPEDATGSVIIYVGGKDYPAEIKNGNATVTIDDLPVGTHTIVAVYSGDDHYDSDVVIGSIVVSKVDPEITVSDIGGNVGDTVETTVTIAGGDATGYILFNDKYYVVEDGQATVPVTIETSGMQSITVVYTGDDKYNNGTGVKAFNAGKSDSSISADVPEDADVDEELPVTVTVTPEGATGNYSVFIDGVDVTSEYGELIIVDGKGSFILPGLTAGNHTIGVKYNGDVNYEASEMAEYIVEVSKIDIADDIEIEGSEITYGDTATVSFELPEDAAGNVTVIVDGVEYNATVDEGLATVEIPGLDAGLYEDLQALYSGDDKYAPYEGVVTIVVVPFDVDWGMEPDEDQFIDVNDTVTVKLVDVTEGAEGNITITIDGVEYGNYTLEEALAGIELTGFDTPGTYTVEVAFIENPNYEYAPSLIFDVIVDTIDADMNVTVPEGLKVGDTVNITVELPEDAAGEVVVFIDGVEVASVDVEGGKVIVPVDDLAAGEHNVVVIYSGDDKYDTATEETILNVSKVDPTIEIAIDDDDAVVGGSVHVTVTLPDDATDYVLVDVNGMQFFGELEEGVYSFDIDDLEALTYDIEVTYVGDDKYNKATKSANFTVRKSNATIDAMLPGEAYVGDFVVVEVTVDPAVATGNYSVFIDGVDVSEQFGDLNIANGKGSFVITALTNGTHTIGVRYNGDNNYEASDMREYTIVINKVDVSGDINIEGSESAYGETATVTFELPDDATGTVTVTVNGIDYFADVDGGVAVVEIPGLDADIYENVAAKYSGDDKYEAYEGNATIEVEPLFVDWFLDNDDIYIDVNETVTLNIYDVTEGGEGSINVTVNGEEFGVYSLGQALAGIEIDVFNAPGTYTVVFAFVDNPNFEYASPVDVCVIVNTIDAGMEVDLPVDVEVGDVAVVTVELPEDATGEVTVYVDGKEVDTVPVEDGKATVPVEGLTAGNHTVSVVYSGDDKYKPEFPENINLEVTKVNSTVIAEAEDIQVGEDAVITVTVPDDATGYVLVEVGDEKSYNTIENGKVTVTISGLSAGEKDVTVKFVGDDKYSEMENSTKFTVNKVDDYDIVINATGDTDNTVVDVQLPNDASGNVTVTDESGNNFTAPVNNGKASVDVSGLPEGKNNLTVSYSGDDKYAPVTEEITTDTSKASIKETLLYGAKVEMTVGDGSKFTVILTDKDGNPIAGKGIKVNITGKTYTIKTDANGVASLPINLKAGSYPVTAIFKGDEDFKPSNVVSTSIEVYTKVRITENKDLVKTQGGSEPFKVRALDKYGKPVGAYAKVKMTISGKTYTVNTDANGYASLAINLKAGTYQIITEYGGTKVTNQITVKKK